MRARDRLVAFNDRVKLAATMFQALGLGFIALGAVRPLIETGATLDAVWWTLVGFVLIGVAHYMLGFQEKEIDHDS